MNIRTGARGRPRKVENDPALAPLVAEIEAADAKVLECVRAHARERTQAALVALLDAQICVASLRAHLARRARADQAHKHETEMVIKLAAARDDAVGRLWGDELRQLRALVLERAAVHAEIAAELAAEAEESAGEGRS